MPAKTETSWHQPAAELMAREGLSLREAATRLKVPITTEDAANTFRSKGFQRLLRAERFRYFGEMGSDAEWRKKTAVGQLLYCAQQLIDNGEFDKAAEVIMKASKVEGWLGSETNVNVFAGLSARELEEVRSRVERTSRESPVGASEPRPN